jgi:hypothetical protein
LLNPTLIISTTVLAGAVLVLAIAEISAAMFLWWSYRRHTDLERLAKRDAAMGSYIAALKKDVATNQEMLISYMTREATRKARAVGVRKRANAADDEEPQPQADLDFVDFPSERPM